MLICSMAALTLRKYKLHVQTYEGEIQADSFNKTASWKQEKLEN
jgi:hypothetical protein